MTPESEIKRVIDRLKSLEAERAPSTILDKGDAKILLDHIEAMENLASVDGDPGPFFVFKKYQTPMDKLAQTYHGQIEWIDKPL